MSGCRGSVYLLSGAGLEPGGGDLRCASGAGQGRRRNRLRAPAITAVVLGGTSIFGGRGSVPGTLLGLFAIAVSQNGMLLAELPAELAGVLTGALLLVAIGLDRRASLAEGVTNGSSDRVVT